MPKTVSRGRGQNSFLRRTCIPAAAQFSVGIVSMSRHLQLSLLFVAVLVMMVPTSESQAMDARRRRTSSASSFDDNARRRRTDSFSDSRQCHFSHYLLIHSPCLSADEYSTELI